MNSRFLPFLPTKPRAPSTLSSGNCQLTANRGTGVVVPETFATSHQDIISSKTATVIRAIRPAQWLKNGVVFAGLVFGGKLLEPTAVVSAALGLVVERWLFFAEAKHTVTLYYGADAA